ncbi:hypothetical protein QTO01_11235 [Vibrio mytili]|uniref:hypothetical protein n=1 Tax=Vibrio mytili TaxID=50718 RepID=UPI002F3E60FE
MSILTLAPLRTKEIEIKGETFTFESLSVQEQQDLSDALAGDANTLPRHFAELLANKLKSETVTPEQLLSAYDFDDLADIAMAAVNGFVGVEEAGKN